MEGLGGERLPAIWRAESATVRPTGLKGAQENRSGTHRGASDEAGDGRRCTAERMAGTRCEGASGDSRAPGRVGELQEGRVVPHAQGIGGGAPRCAELRSTAASSGRWRLWMAAMTVGGLRHGREKIRMRMGSACESRTYSVGESRIPRRRLRELTRAGRRAREGEEEESDGWDPAAEEEREGGADAERRWAPGRWDRAGSEREKGRAGGWERRHAGPARQ